MHEYRFASEIINELKKRFNSNELNCPVLVKVKLSPLGHVTPEGLQGAFELLAETEKINGARLAVEPMEFEISCRSCGHVFKSTRPVLNCPACKSADFAVKKGREFSIESIQVFN